MNLIDRTIYFENPVMDELLGDLDSIYFEVNDAFTGDNFEDYENASWSYEVT